MHCLLFCLLSCATTKVWLGSYLFPFMFHSLVFMKRQLISLTYNVAEFKARAPQPFARSFWLFFRSHECDKVSSKSEISKPPMIGFEFSFEYSRGLVGHGSSSCIF
eukprot:GHVT01089145.1.p1 GENE.GHVT01089145.1~~GHVT01089145.1.p1  ORF type:complete len:106 (-),score=0.76 GHVT01089145.1:105-422(-)